MVDFQGEVVLSMDAAIVHGKVLTPNGILENGAVLMRAGKIVAVCGSQGLDLPPGIEVIEANGLSVAPGFVDAHTHGGVGYDFMTCTLGELNQILSWLPSTGVTCVLPTLASSALKEEIEMVRRLREAQSQPSPGTVVYGLHLEGPYLNPEKSGAQPQLPIRLPDLEEMRRLLDASGHTVRLVTLAPELPGALELISYLITQGVVVSAGHSNATYEAMLAACQAGLSRAAHLFNGMPPFHHRLPGVVGAVLEREDLYAEIVLDGIHIHPAVARITVRAKGVEKVVLVTDATQAAGKGDGVYVRPGNRVIIVKNGVARLESGGLAGSVLTMNQAVANALHFLGLPFHQAVNLASYNAARSLAIWSKGALAPGFDADVILIDDEVNVHAAFVAGVRVY